MTNEEKNDICRKCINRQHDIDKGILCGITNEKGVFEASCKDFLIDESVNEIPNEEEIEAVGANKIISTLPQEFIEKLRVDQNLPKALIAGIIASLASAILWAVISVSSGYQIGYMAIAVGAVVGFTIRIAGKGIDKIFGYWGAALALFGCVLGNLLMIVGSIGNEFSIGYWEVFSSLKLGDIFNIMKETFDFMDLLFYGLAIYEGYKFSFRKITVEEIESFRNRAV